METTGETRRFDGTEIAVIGIACRFPGANGKEDYWRNLCCGREAITHFTEDELEPSGIDPAALAGSDYVRAAPVLDGIDLFDAGFFGITPAEAELMDPQQRLFMECAWEALEDAGCDPDRYGDPVGVFAGNRTNSYLFNIYSNPELVARTGAFEIGLGNDLAFLATRVSHKLNLRGPSYSLHTACSTSLVAVHLACQSLLMNECGMALAGGAAILIPQKTGYVYRRGGILSPDGHCRPFDREASGTLFGSGVGLVALKRLSDAISQRDHVYAVIRGSATNNDGAVKASFTAPSVRGQTEVILEALAAADVDPASIGYIEAHGTGTALGDPIEVRALTEAFRGLANGAERCALGSVKSNIGHLDAAAGIASFIKAVIAVERGLIPPTLHFESPNPQIDFSQTPFYVNTRLSQWPDLGGGPRRAGVSAFGIGGTNAHVVVEQPPESANLPARRRSQIFLLSARSSTALDAATANCAAFFADHPDIGWADAAYTSQTGRRAFKFRRAVISRGATEARRALETLDSTRVHTGQADREERPVVFLFPGQGAQQVDMGRALYESEPVFRRELDSCADLVESQSGFDLRAILYPVPDRRTEASESLRDTRYAQPALFAVEFALARLWMSWGIQPESLAGHSLGEYVAACVAGVFSLEDALSVIAERSERMQAQPRGAMLAAAIREGEARALVGREIALAAVNGPEQCVLSGSLEAITELERRLARTGRFVRQLDTSHAFHSPMMEPVAAALIAKLKKIRLQAPAIPYVSNLTGSWIRAEEATDPEYWGRQLLCAVHFGSNASTLMEDSSRVMLEVGPGHTLSNLISASAAGRGRAVSTVATLPYSSAAGSDESACTAAARLWTEGVAIDWDAYHRDEPRNRVPLPAYPWQRQRYWVQARSGVIGGEHAHAQAGKIADVGRWFFAPSWKITPANNTGRTDRVGRWLVFRDDFGACDTLIGQLQSRGEEIVTVQRGTGFERLGENAFAMDCNRPDHYDRLIRVTAETGAPFEYVIHAWTLSNGQGSRHNRSQYFRGWQQAGYYSLCRLARALAGQPGTSNISVTILSNELFDVSGSEAIVPEKAPMVGAAVVIQQEATRLSIKVIDVPVERCAPPETSARILAEASTPAGDRLIALRGARRWTRSFEPVEIGSSASPRRMLRDGGVYLITGAFGRVGMLVSDYLARVHRARLVLVGRIPIPDRATWGAIPEGEIGRRIRAILEFESAGAEVMTALGDVSDAAFLAQVVDSAIQRFGALDGVLHAAGVTEGPSLYRPYSELDEPESEQQFGPKVYGLYALEQALAGRSIDFCALFSSNAAILGGLGYSAYSAANSFMDAFAAERARSGGSPWISVNWDPWPKETKVRQAAFTAIDQYAMTVDESMDALRRVLTAAPAGQVVVATGDLEARLDLWLRKMAAEPGAESAGSRPALETPFEEPAAGTETAIAQIWKELLGLKQVGANDSFFDLGGHSLLSMRLIGRIREQFETDVAIGDFFESPTVRAVARMVDMPVRDDSKLVHDLLSKMEHSDTCADPANA